MDISKANTRRNDIPNSITPTLKCYITLMLFIVVSFICQGQELNKVKTTAAPAENSQSSQAESSTTETTDSEENSPEQDAPVNNLTFYMLLAATLLGATLVLILSWRRYKARIPKGILHKKYTRFELSNDNTQLDLYLRHEKQVSVSLAINEIKQSDLLLNGHIINTSSRSPKAYFSTELEEDVRLVFAKEKRHKMTPEKLRKIDLVLTLRDNSKYLVCFYLRKGNHRLTKPCYDQSVEDAIYWLWVFSKSISEQDISIPIKRVIAEKQSALHINKVQTQKTNSTQKAELAGADTSATKPTDSVENHNDNQIEHTPDTPIESFHIYQEGHDAEVSNQHASSPEYDVELISALEKLASLKQQGHINEQEFTVAKAKLLQDLLK